jgi:hypothetical protein
MTSDILPDYVTHLHGEVGNSPLMGVDNISQIGNVEFQKNTKVQRLMIKPQTNAELLHGVQERASTLIDGESTICIIGSSLGASDLMWWNKLGTWLKGDHARKLVIFWYEPTISPTHPDIGLNTDEFARNKFLENAGLAKDEGSKISDRIFVHPHKGIFNSKLTAKYNSLHKRILFVRRTRPLFFLGSAILFAMPISVLISVFIIILLRTL